MRCTTAEPHSVSVRACYHRLFCDWTPAITSCVLCRAFPGTAGWTCEGRILSFPGVSPSCSAVRARTERGLLSQHVVGAQTETPRREAWGFVFPKCRAHLQSRLASGLEKLASCWLMGVRGKTSDEGFMGARRSIATGSARWFPNTWEPPLLTWVV